VRRAPITFVLLGLLAAPLATAMTPAPAPAPKTKPAAKPAGPPQLKDAKAWVVIDPRDGTALSSKAPDRELPIASTTKLMTAYLALKELKPSQKLRAPRYNAQDAESLLGLRVGEKMSVRDLIFALVLQSANDAAETLAVGVSGSVGAFVGDMNTEAQALGLTETHYSTPVGLDHPGNYSSASDLVKLAGELLRNPLFAKAADSPSAILKTGDHPRRIVTRNLLIDSTPYVTGVKTGHTLDAGYVLVGSGEKSGTTLISAVLGTPSEAARDNDTLALLNYGFAQYKPQAPVKKDEKVADTTLDYRRGDLDLIAARAVPVSTRPGQKIATSVDAPGEIKGAVSEGQKLGTVSVTVDDRPAGNSPLLAAKSVAAASLPQKVVAAVLSPLILVPIGLLLLIGGTLLVRRGGGGGTDEGEREPKTARSAAERERMRKERIRRRSQLPRSPKE
jgi:D-alanyl-D-alanine carboxypeptidase (penicillin-binding protein 5/6)